MIADLDGELYRVVNARFPAVSVRKKRVMIDEPWFVHECRTAYERK